MWTYLSFYAPVLDSETNMSGPTGILRGKTAIITGAGSGIGRAVAELFATEAASVVVVDRNAEAGREVADEITSRGGAAFFHQADVADEAQAKASIAVAVERFGRLDLLVNNAGVIRRQPVTGGTVEEWDRVVAVNLRSVFLMSRFAIPRMVEVGGGVILNTGSGWGLKGGPLAASYCAAKAAVVNLTRAMAIDHAKDGIRVNCVCPGDTDTAMLRSECEQIGGNLSHFLREAAARPLGRVGEPREIADAFLFLATDRASFITGAILPVDGGGTAG